MNKELFNEIYKVAQERRTTKNYNPNKDVDAQTMKEIYEFTLTAPHTLGLEWIRHITFDRNSEHREAVDGYLAGFNKDKASKASVHGLIITKKANFFENAEKVESGVRRVSEAGAKAAGVPLNEEMLKGTIGAVVSGVFGHGANTEQWIAKQAYIQLGYILLGAATLGVNTTAMEGFDDSINQYLVDSKLIEEDEIVASAVLFGIVDETVERPFVGPKQLRISIEDFWKAK